MRIARIILKGDTNTWNYGIPEEIVGQGFESHPIETKLPLFPYNQLIHKLMELTIIEAGLRAEIDGCDAIFVSTVGDYGLNALKSAVKLPVVGACQATMHVAATLGERFSIVTVWPPSLAYIYEGNLKNYGLNHKCASVRYVTEEAELLTLNQPRNFYKDLHERDEMIVNRIAEECNKAIDVDGADTIMLGCTCMSPAHKKIAERCNAPVLNPLTTGYKYTEMLLALGLTQSERAYAHVKGSSHEQFQAMVEAAGGKQPEEWLYKFQ